MERPVPPPPPPVGNSDDDPMLEDKRLFLRTVTAFRQYARQARAAMTIRRDNFDRLSDAHKQQLVKAGINVDGVFQAYLNGISWNQKFLADLTRCSEDLFASYWPDADADATPHDSPSSMDFDKVFSTLRLFVRDWSAEGALERQQVHAPIVSVLEASFPQRDTRNDIRILVPGAGLCRLSVELALRGFFTQSNEFSYHMLIAGHFIQNEISAPGAYQLLPYVDNTCNLLQRSDQFVPVAIPDLCTMHAVDALMDAQLHFGDLSMVAGDFTDVYKKSQQRHQWDAVASCFFLDTARNIVEYLNIIHDMLKPGGLLLNVGPLVYHFADSPPEPGHENEVNSIELALDELLALASVIGFDLHISPQFIDTTYTNNPRSMKQLMYRAAFFVLRKR